MPRVHLGFRDPITVHLDRQTPHQFRQLLHDDLSHITISRVNDSSLEGAYGRIKRAHRRHRQIKNIHNRYLLKSPNEGYTIAVKDNFVTRDLPTTCASSILDGFAAEDATVVRLLKDAGMELVAKTNMDEFGMGSHSTHSVYGAVRNNAGGLSISAGGSSGGSALAVASRLTHTAIGSDTGGSVRLPAAYTSIVGFKPSYGTISRHGLIPYANSLDTVGLFGTSCEDVYLLYRILAKADDQDPTCLTSQTRKRISTARQARNYNARSISKSQASRIIYKPEQQQWKYMHPSSYSRRIGVPVEYNIKELHSDVRNAWIRTLSNLESLGHEIVPISLPSTQQALSAYYVLAPAEASSNLAKYDGVRYGKLRDAELKDDEGGTLYSEYRGAFFGDEVKRRILLGSFTLSAGSMDNYFIQAQKVRRIVQSDFDAVFRMPNPLLPNAAGNPEGVDYILCPTAPTPPPTLVEVKRSSPLESYINDVFTVPASLAGLPAVSVPFHSARSYQAACQAAIGMQIIGQFGDDVGVLGFSRYYVERQPPDERYLSILGRQPRLR